MLPTTSMFRFSEPQRSSEITDAQLKTSEEKAEIFASFLPLAEIPVEDLNTADPQEYREEKEEPQTAEQGDNSETGKSFEQNSDAEKKAVTVMPDRNVEVEDTLPAIAAPTVISPEIGQAIGLTKMMPNKLDAELTKTLPTSAHALGHVAAQFSGDRSTLKPAAVVWGMTTGEDNAVLSRVKASENHTAQGIVKVDNPKAEAMQQNTPKLQDDIGRLQSQNPTSEKLADEQEQKVLNSLSQKSDANADVPNLQNVQSIESKSITRVSEIPNGEMPRHIARQLYEIAQRFPNQPVELSLNPEELGRVRMVISTQDAGVSITVSVDRTETLELLRRHIDELTQEFHTLGFEDITFLFQQNNRQKDEPDGSIQREPETGKETSDASVLRLLISPSTGLDLRL